MRFRRTIFAHIMDATRAATSSVNGTGEKMRTKIKKVLKTRTNLNGIKSIRELADIFVETVDKLNNDGWTVVEVIITNREITVWCEKT